MNKVLSNSTPFFSGPNHIHYWSWQPARLRCLGAAFSLSSPMMWNGGWEAHSMLWGKPWTFLTTPHTARGLEKAQLPLLRREHPAGSKAAGGGLEGCLKLFLTFSGAAQVQGWQPLMGLRCCASRTVATRCWTYSTPVHTERGEQQQCVSFPWRFEAYQDPRTLLHKLLLYCLLEKSPNISQSGY